MAKIYRTTDRISLQVGELKVIISPLTTHQKSAVEDAVDGTSAGLMSAARLAIKFAVKSIDGLTDAKDKKYTVELDENNEVTDSSIDDIFNIHETPRISAIAMNLINGVPSRFFDAMTGKPLEGVEFIEEKKDTPLRKKIKRSAQ